MSGTPRHGRQAQVMIDTSSNGTTACVDITSKAKWSFDQSVDFVDVTAFRDTSKAAVAGLPNATGSIDGFWDSADTAIYNIIGATSERKMYIYPDVTNNATSYIAGKFFFSVKAQGGTAEAVGQTIDFQAGASGAGWIHP